MFKVYLIVGLFVVFPDGALCQLNPSFEAVLKTVLTDSVVAAEVFNKKWKSAYVYANREIDKQVSDYDSLSDLSKKFYTLDSALTNKLFATEHGLVLLFRYLDGLVARSKYEIEKVIVIDKYKKTKSKSRIVFHTTNCHSSIGYKGPSFKKFKCELVLDDNTWVIRNVYISLTKFKSIAD